jgi:hypothetical protein
MRKLALLILLLAAAGCREVLWPEERAPGIVTEPPPVCTGSFALTQRELYMWPEVPWPVSAARTHACVTPVRLVWTSSRPEVATVESRSDTSAIVTSIRNGKAVIRASVEGSSTVLDSLQVVVMSPLSP